MHCTGQGMLYKKEKDADFGEKKVDKCIWINILRGILHKNLFGFGQVNSYFPGNLKEKSGEFCPLICYWWWRQWNLYLTIWRTIGKRLVEVKKGNKKWLWVTTAEKILLYTPLFK